MKWVLIVALFEGGVSPIGDYPTESECKQVETKVEEELRSLDRAFCVQSYILEPAR